MAMTQTHHHAPHQHARKRRAGHPRGMLWLPVVIFVAGVIAAGSWVTYILWPRWPAADMSIDAPSAADHGQRRQFQHPADRDPQQGPAQAGHAGAGRSRVPVAFAEPPDPAIKAAPASSPARDRPGVRHHCQPSATPCRRSSASTPSIRAIWNRASRPRRIHCAQAIPRRHALSGRRHHLQRPQSGRFMVRCTRDNATGAAIGMCLFERRIDTGRHHGPLPARLAVGVADGVGRSGQADQADRRRAAQGIVAATCRSMSQANAADF